MRTPDIPVENRAELVWGALLVIYLISAGRPEYLQWPVLAVFALSAAAALLELYLRRRHRPWLAAYDCLVWTVLLSAMVAVTGGRGSDIWPAYTLMSLTAPSLGRPALHYGLMAANSLLYAGIYYAVNPYGAPFQPGLLLLRVGLFFLITYVVDRSMARERAAMQQAIDASRTRVSELVSARDAERRRMAGDIHDWLGSGIVAPMRKLELALRAPDMDAARPRIDEALRTLRGAHDELRRLMEELHPHLLEQLGLTAALHAYVDAWGQEHGVAVAYRGDSAPLPPGPVALAAYRILQEALNNVARHAGARAVQVALSLRQQSLTLTVTDDGRGFDRPAPGGRGLAGMRERAGAFGGTTTIVSQSNGGTTVTARIPWQGEVGALPRPRS